MASGTPFWNTVDAFYSLWDLKKDSWGSCNSILFIAGKSVEKGDESAVDKAFDVLFNAFFSNTPVYFTQEGKIGIFASKTNQEAMKILEEFQGSHTIGQRICEFTIHDKNRKEPEKDIAIFTDLLQQQKATQLGLVYDEKYVEKYVLDFLNQVKAYCGKEDRPIKTLDINKPLFKFFSTPIQKVKEEDEAPTSALSERRERVRTVATSQFTQERDRERANRALAADVAERALARLRADSSLLDEFKDPAQRVVTSYQHLKDGPADQNPKQIYIDAPRDTILFPINSQLVPFHISTIKNVTKSEEGEYFKLSVEFVTPTAKRLPPGSQPDHTFIRSLQYRSKGAALSEIAQTVRRLQTEYKSKLKALASTSQMVEQPKLISMKNPNVILRDVSSKPQIAPAKGSKGRAAGTITAHNNGFRYLVADKTQGGGLAVEIIYSNIKSCFIKRADRQNSTLTLIHFEFHSPIIVKKDKVSKFFQIFVELSEESYDTSRSNMNDNEAELLEKQQEEQLAKSRKQWNEKFANFADLVEHQWNANNPDLQLEFEIPDKNLKFQGIVNKDQVDVFPTKTGQNLIALEATPVPFVISIAEIECVALERVGFGLREFDMVFIFKDFRTEPRMITSIPFSQIETVRRILQDNEILFIESKINLSWKSLLDEIKQDLVGFYEDGGWLSFFDNDEDEDGDEDDEDDEEDGGKKNKSKYEDSDSDFELDEASSSDEEYTSDSESGDDDDDDSGSEDSGSGEDWSDLEDDAQQDDRRFDKVQDRDGKDKKDKKSKR